MLSRLGVEITDLGVVRDQPDLLEVALKNASQKDVIITTGGVSVGEADFVKQLMAKLGEVLFWKIAMRPGRPMAFGKVGDAWLFGLPGNPVAVMVTFYQFVQPALRRLMGEPPPLPPLTFRARALSRFATRVGRTELIRGILERDAQGAPVVRSTGSQGSGILSSMSTANCFIVLPPESAGADPGDEVDVLPFSGLL
jgi:molybdopterin molybdotransferase